MVKITPAAIQEIRLLYAPSIGGWLRFDIPEWFRVRFLSHAFLYCYVGILTYVFQPDWLWMAVLYMMGHDYYLYLKYSRIRVKLAVLLLMRGLDWRSV